jgi:flavin prenyltransferase
MPNGDLRNHEHRLQRLVVGISGASGVIYGIRLLEVLRQIPEVETHLIISGPGRQTILAETEFTVRQVEEMASVTYDNRDVGAAVASGSFKTNGMAIAPCSIKTLSALANCYADTLMARAGDVTLKERRPLVVAIRETPLHVGHLRLMLDLAQMGAIIMPPLPAFYHRPKTLDDIIDHTVGRILDRFGLDHSLAQEWPGIRQALRLSCSSPTLPREVTTGRHSVGRIGNMSLLSMPARQGGQARREESDGDADAHTGESDFAG